jgi:hypothetical protein
MLMRKMIVGVTEGDKPHGTDSLVELVGRRQSAS